MDDQVIDKAWSSIQVNDFVRWATPRFIKYGRVEAVGGNSMRVRFINDAQARAIPEAKWYFVQGKANPEAEEHLVCIDYKAWYNGPPIEPFIPPADNAHDQYISVETACEMLNMDAKRLRRYIRRGVIPAFKRDDRWVIPREALREAAVKNQWL